MFRQTLSQLMRQRRKALAVHPDTLAMLAGIPQPRWSQLERGTRAPRRTEITKIAEALKLPPGKVGDSPRPPDKIHAKLRLSRLRSTAKFKAYFPPCKRQAHHWYTVAQQAWPLEVRDLAARVALREDFPKIEYLCGKLALRSAEDCLFVLRLLDQGAEPALVAPIRLAYLPHPLIDPVSRRRVEYRPFPCLILGGSTYFFGATVEASDPFTVDVLVWNGEWSAYFIERAGTGAVREVQLPRRFLLPVERLKVGEVAA